MNLKKNKNESEDIDFIKIIIKLWHERILIIKTLILFSTIGILYSLSLKNIYTASSTFYLHYQGVENNDNIRNLAGLAGINLSNQVTSDIPPSLYPQLIGSIPFKKDILSQTIKLDERKFTYKNYLMNKNNNILSNIFDFILNLPLKFINIILSPLSTIKENENKNINFEDADYIFINETDYKLYQRLDKSIKIEVNAKDNYIELLVEDEIPEIAAYIAKKSEEILQESVINYKLKNIRSLYNFTLEQYNLNKNNFYKLQDSLANFKDSNKNIKSDIFKNQLDRLTSEYSIANSIYNELSLNKERTKIDVQKNTPIFTIIDPVSLPIIKSSPNRFIIVILNSLSGFILISFWILFKHYIIKIKERIIKF